MKLNIFSQVERKKIFKDLLSRQQGKVVVKFFWWPLIISLGLSLLLTIILNLVF